MLVIAYLIFVSTSIHQVVLAQDSCNKLKCSWTVSNQTLNLTVFQALGVKLSKYDENSDLLYSITPCNNILSSFEPFGYMAVSSTIDGDQPQALGIYDPDIQPTIKPDGPGEFIWNFQYNATLSVQFSCNHSLSPSTFMNLTEVVQTFPGSFIFRISSYYFCTDVTIPDDFILNHCLWRDATNEHFLDLRPLFGQTIQLYIGSNVTICQNAYYAFAQGDMDQEHGNSQCVMADECDPSSNNCSLPLSLSWYDSNLQPTYTEINETWTFPYEGEQGRINWKCDPTIANYSIETNPYGALVTISSAHACPTQLPCIFTDPNGNNTLDLTDLSGQMIQYIYEDETQSFEYSVCRNNINCPGMNDVRTMAVRWNVTYEHCDPYLAIFDGNNGFQLTYNENGPGWRFSYYNGAICSETQTNMMFDIYWSCNENVTDWQVTEVDTYDECGYAMFIDSSHAC